MPTKKGASLLKQDEATSQKIFPLVLLALEIDPKGAKIVEKID